MDQSFDSSSFSSTEINLHFQANREDDIDNFINSLSILSNESQQSGSSPINSIKEQIHELLSNRLESIYLKQFTYKDLLSQYQSVSQQMLNQAQKNARDYSKTQKPFKNDEKLTEYSLQRKIKPFIYQFIPLASSQEEQQKLKVKHEEQKGQIDEMTTEMKNIFSGYQQNLTKTEAIIAKQIQYFHEEINDVVERRKHKQLQLIKQIQELSAELEGMVENEVSEGQLTYTRIINNIREINDRLSQQ